MNVPSTALAVVLALTAQAAAAAPSGITFDDVAAGDGAGITYRRAESASNAVFDALKQLPVYTFGELLITPFKPRGAPGVAIFDYDGDGDLDLYVTNGPGADNSLYSNQLQETGQLHFVDVAAAAGVGARAQDSTGVCYGDLDNDGDHDLMVLGNEEPSRQFENAGDGSFSEISAASGVAGTARTSTSCSMGDVNGDGLLDIFVANWATWRHQLANFAVPFAFNEHNELYLNSGGNTFIDVSTTSGIQSFAGLPLPFAGSATLTWAAGLVDYDQDGDVDLVAADDQGSFPGAEIGGVDRGAIRVLRNDGSGQFTDVTAATATDVTGAWMGLAFGDLDHDGNLDLFATNFGSYSLPLFGGPPAPSQWYLGQNDGTFVADADAAATLGSPFGWGTSIADYDNDGHPDILYHGGLDGSLFVDATNPGAILRNGGTADFSRDGAALAGSTDHRRRAVHGMAVGDLNGDGSVDVVSVSAFDTPTAPLVLFSDLGIVTGGPFDADAAFVSTFSSIPGGFQWSGLVFPDGTLSVEVNSADNGNRWVEVELRGSVGTLSDGRVNRDGIGALVFFTPQGGETSIQPVLGGSSYASQDSLAAGFGLGQVELGTVEVLWPGGVRNRLNGVRHGERVLFPEIPVSFDDPTLSLSQYEALVAEALDQLIADGVIPQNVRGRFLSSALRAFTEQPR